MIREKKIINNYNISNISVLSISEEIIAILEKIYGKYHIDSIKREKPGEWLITLGDINKAIEETYSVDGIEIYEINIKYKNKGKYEYLYQTETGTKKYIIEYNEFSLIFPAGLIGNIIHKKMNNFISNINNIINVSKQKSIHIDSIIITGGLSNNKLYKNEIKSGLSKIPVKYLTSIENAVSKGAVIYGVHPEKINTRIFPVNIGIRKKEENSEKIEILAKKGEEFNNFTIVKFIKPILDNQDIIQLNIYISENEISENNFMGRLLIYNERKKNRIIQLTIKYDIILTFSAIDYETQKEINCKFEFFKSK